MAKKSQVVRDRKRERLIQKYAERRAELAAEEAATAVVVDGSRVVATVREPLELRSPLQLAGTAPHQDGPGEDESGPAVGLGAGPIRTSDLERIEQQRQERPEGAAPGEADERARAGRDDGKKKKKPGGRKSRADDLP